MNIHISKTHAEDLRNEKMLNTVVVREMQIQATVRP